MSQQQLNIPYGEVRHISQTEGRQNTWLPADSSIISAFSIFLAK